MNGKWKKKRKLKNDAVSEIIGTVVLLAVAVASFSVLYVTLSATLVTEDSAQVNVIGYIEGNNIVLEHQGGDTLKDNTKIDFVIGGRSQSFTLTSSNDNFTFYDGNNNGEWDVGEKITFSSSESFSGLAVDTSVVDTAGNTALFIGSLQEGDTNATPVVDLSTVVEMLPFTIDTSPFQINATGSSQLDSVSLYYAFSSSNWTSCSDQRLTYDDFEDGFGNFTSGGSNCDIYSGGSQYAHQGNNAIHIQNSGDAASFYLTESVDIDSPNYSTITVDFWFIKNANPGASRQFTIDYYDGSDWQNIITYSLSEYNNDEFYHETVWINETDYTFPSDMNIRFKGSMPNNNDDVYFDQIYINATCDGGSSSNEPVWMQYNTDLNSPWNWDFSFSNGTGYYRFYSIGEYDGNVEAAPSTADAFCYYNTSTASNQISIWHFDESTGSIAYDSADDNDGTINGATWTTGVQDSALSFDGDDDYVFVADSENLNFVGNFTAMAWVKWSVDPETGDSWANILNKGRDAQWQIQHSYDNSQFEFAVNTENTRRWAYSSTEVKQGIWYHVAGVYDGSEIRIYVNGTHENQEDLTGDVFVTDYPVNIGRRSDYNDRYFAGIIDEVYLYNRTLSAEELQNYYNQSKPQSSDNDSLITHWEFDEDAGSNAFDSSGNNNNGSISDASWTTGVNGSALLFNGVDSNVRVDRNNHPELDPVENITVMAWVKNTDLDGNYMSNIIGRSGGSAGYSYRLYLNDGSSDDNLGVEVRTETGVQSYEWAWDEMNESWFHMTMTFSNANDGTVTLYHNGEQVDQWMNVGQNLVYRTEYEGDDVYIGSGYQYTTNFFTGKIDDMRIYQDTLSDGMIGEIYNQTKPDMSNLVSSWDFNEDAGSIAYDSSDGNDGNIYGATWTTGVNGSGLFFDNQAGQDEYVTVSDDENLDLTTEGSVEAWVKINSYQDYAGIVHKGNQNDFSDEAYTLQFWDNGRTILFGGNDDSGDSITIESSEELDLDQWYHIVGTWDESSIKVYINGALDVEESFTIDAIKDTDGSLQIGAQLTENYAGYGYFGFDGIIDQVAIYNTALELNEIQEEYNRSKPDDSISNQIGHWQFDEGTGSIAFDSINGNNGAINGATWTTGKDESGLNFDGTQQDYVNIPYDNSIALNHNYSVAFWIYPTDETVQWRTFLTRSNQFTCSYIGNDEIRVHVNGYANIDSQTSAPRNSWTHVVFTFENSEAGDDKIIIYMNGESDGQVGPTWGTPNTPTNSLILGGDASSSYFTGSLDEIIIYDKALSADEVSTLYSQYD